MLTSRFFLLVRVGIRVFRYVMIDHLVHSLFGFCFGFFLGGESPSFIIIVNDSMVMGALMSWM